MADNNLIEKALDGMASSFWCMFGDQPEREIPPVPSEDAYNFPECDYDRNPTNLYKQIEAKNWTSVNHFLLTGYWSGSFFADSTAPTEQACTWVTKYDPNIGSKRKKVMWTHLPIHAAISFGAPEGVIQLLVKLAPPTLRCADDQRMLPLHLAFRRGATDTTIAAIMDVFPEGVAVRDFLGRTPAECSSEGPNPKRGTIIQTVLYYNQKAWEKKANKGQEKHLESVKASLKQKSEKIENIQTAFDLVRCREDQSRQAFAKVMAELSKFKVWYDEKTTADFVENGGVLSATFVKELSDRLEHFYDTTHQLNSQQKKAKKDLDSTLKDLKAVWDINGWDFKVRSFRDALDKQEESDASSSTSLITSSTAKKEKEAKDASKEAPKEAPAKAKEDETNNHKVPVPNPMEYPSLFKADSTQADSKTAAKSKAGSKTESKEKSKTEEAKAATQAEPEAIEQEAEERKHEKVAKNVVEQIATAEENPKNTQEETPKEAKEESPKMETPKQTAKATITEIDKTTGLPHVVSIEKTSEDGSDEGEIKQTISEMTSLDMSEQGSKSSSKKKFRLGSLIPRSKKGSKGSKGSKDSVNGNGSVKAGSLKAGSVKSGSKGGSKSGSLPPKNSKPGKLSVMKKGGGSVKVTPTA